MDDRATEDGADAAEDDAGPDDTDADDTDADDTHADDTGAGDAGADGRAAPTVRTRAYREGALLARDFAIEEVAERLAEDDVTVWVDLVAPRAEDLERLANELGFHELAVEDSLSPHQRPKLDVYEDHLFLACHALSLDAEAGELSDQEVDAFVDRRWAVTVRKDAAFDLHGIDTRLERAPDLLAHGGPFILYTLLDEVVDRYFDAVADFDAYYDDASEGLFADHPLDPAQQRQWFQMRRALARFHRLVMPLREAISSLRRREHAIVAEELVPYFQDLYDHILVVVESADALRDLVSSIVETNLSLRDYRQNQVVKKVTSWAAIVAVPTMITGFYGMNVPFPGSGRTWGFVASLVLMAGVSAVLYGLFRRRDWL